MDIPPFLADHHEAKLYQLKKTKLSVSCPPLTTPCIVRSSAQHFLQQVRNDGFLSEMMCVHIHVG
jgi:hypothetical protein